MELVGEGPIFMTVKPVRGELMMKELKENLRKMRHENAVRLYLNHTIATWNYLDDQYKCT